MKRRCVPLLLLALAGAAQGALARDVLGIYKEWAAFRDREPAGKPSRCYAIAQPGDIAGEPEREAFVSVGVWANNGVRGQFHVRLSRDRSTSAVAMVSLGGRSFRLTGNRSDLYAESRAMDRAIIAAIRTSSSLSVESIGRDGGPLVDAYNLKGAASAIDAARIGCL